METNHSVEHYLLNDEFCLLAQSYSRCVDFLAAWQSGHPGGNPEAQRDAFILLHSVKIEPEEIPAGEIERRLDLLRSTISKKAARSKLVRRISLSLGAAAVLFASAILFVHGPERVERGHAPLAIVVTETSSADEIELTIGEGEPLRLSGNASINQHTDGSIGLGDENMVLDIAGPQYVRLIVPYGKRATVSFSDGTVAWVNSGSQLVYPSVFDGHRREITIAGEVYLDIARDEQRPFHVLAGELDISVLGTEFNVSAYDDDPFARVVLVKGSVQVASADTTTRLEPGQLLSYADGGITVEDVDTSYYTGWKSGYLTLGGDTVDDVLKRIMRYYNVAFGYDTGSVDTRLHGKLDLPDSWSEALDNLSLTVPIRYSLGEEPFIEIER